MATCIGETSGYPVDCYSAADWVVTVDTTNHESPACDTHLGQVVQFLALNATHAELVVRPIRKDGK